MEASGAIDVSGTRLARPGNGRGREVRRMKTNLTDGWRFALTPPGACPGDPDGAGWKDVSLPHDFLIHDADRLYADGDGWYRKTLRFDKSALECETWLCFDGAYPDAAVFVNGEKACEHHYGYTAFDVRLTGLIREGDNDLRVVCRHRAPCSRWYSGAGLFREVVLHTEGKKHILPGSVYFSARRLPSGCWRMAVSCRCAGAESGDEAAFVLKDGAGETILRLTAPVSPEGEAKAEREVGGVRLWDLNDPYVYSLESSFAGSREETTVGFRETAFDSRQGFFLNGKHVKIRGVCLHHDLGALGAAFNVKAAERQLKLMKEMGVNAVRFSHNPPAREMMELCDRMGLLADSELYDMWERSKTPFDHARFFEEDWRENVREWVCRDRNHPSLVMWSIGNEIQDMHVSERGEIWTRLLSEETGKYDPEGNGRVTFGSNYMPWEGAQKCADVIKMPGYNYAEKYYDAHHAAHPDWVIYGSETASVLQSRGVYHFPLDRDILSDDDLQCSALGNSKTSWGSQDPERMLRDEEERPYTLGQFIWSGIDYIGEPTPYHTRTCYFGQADTACFPKDTYYMYKAAWSGEKTVHIGVTWDWNPGQTIDVPVWTNCENIELFLNGRSLGTKSPGRGYRCVWHVPYEEGILEAVGDKSVRDVRSSFGDSASLRLTASADCLKADGKDLCFLTAEALDAQGRTVENAVDRIRVSVEGKGCLMGLDNGDSTDPDGYQVSARRLFGGKLLIIVGALDEPGEICVRISSPGLNPAEKTLTALPCAGEKQRRIPPEIIPGREGPAEVRKIVLKRLDSGVLCPGHDTAEFAVSVLPAGADHPLSFRARNADGITVPGAKIRLEGDRVFLTANGDGEIYLRASAANGEDHPRVLSEMDLQAEGFGKASLDPYTFVSAGLHDMQRGEVTPGNEHGVAFSRDGESMAGFSSVDLGPDGSDTLTLPVFALDGKRYEIELWDGDGPDRKLIARLPYQKECIWNTYQEETWKLPARLRGVHSLCFVMREKIHLKGFVFERQPRLSRWIAAGEADGVWGDSFRREGESVLDIGNNVTLKFAALDLGSGGKRRLKLRGHTDLKENPVALRIMDAAGNENVAMLPFKGNGEGEQTFDIALPAGVCDLSFVFLPGCRFDFHAFRLDTFS